jgi:hypothetical protein
MARTLLWFAVLWIVSPALAPQAQAQGASVQAVFESYDLAGVFSWDCNRPPGKDNLYYVNRVIDAAHVQRDQMSGPANRDYAIILDQAVVGAGNEIVVSGSLDGRPVSGRWRIQRAEPGVKSLSIDEQGHTRLYKCDSDDKTLNLTFDENVNREGRTVREFNLARADARLCQQGCIEENQCTAWVYRAPAGRGDRQPHCWLRNGIEAVERGKTENLTVSGSVRPDGQPSSGSAQTPAASASSAEARLLGCFQDKEPRDVAGYELKNPRMTVAMCTAACREKGFSFAAVEYGQECRCGNSYGRYGSSESCTQKCPGNDAEVCGGFFANSVYQVAPMR